MKKIAFLMTLSAVLAGCADLPSAAKPSLVNSETSVRPQIQSVAPTSAGSLVPAAQVNAVAYRGLFEERRASRAGDTLTVMLNETTRASKDGGTKASRNANNNAGLGVNLTNNQIGQTSTSSSRNISAGLSGNGNTNFDSKGGSTASNQFSGTITVTVMEVLPNGNLSVAGEKRLAVGAEEEVIRFGGIVSPLSIRNNSVLSSQVADARIEYRGAGITDEVQRPGFLTKFLMRYSPN
jgi:flagellar L-ring protein precursor FlgH